MKIRENKKALKLIGVITLLNGVHVCAQSTGILPVDGALLHVPLWVFLLVGVIFVVTGACK
jgi:hypothetical protein